MLLPYTSLTLMNTLTGPHPGFSLIAAIIPLDHQPIPSGSPCTQGFAKPLGFSHATSAHIHRAPPVPPPSHTGPRAGGGAAPPPPPPHPPQLGSHGRGPPPPQGRGGTPPLRRNGDAVRGTAAGPAPANPHRRAGATRTTEQDGGRAPHDPPVTTAHSEVTEEGFRSAGAPGGAVHGPPLTPLHPGAAHQPRPHARAGGERAGDTERARKKYRRPPSGARAGRPRRDTPPPPPHQPASRRGPGPHPPRQGGWAPPAREGSRSVTRPPRPSRRLTWGPQRTSGPTPAHGDAAQIVPKEAG